MEPAPLDKNMGNGACRATARSASFLKVSRRCETENVEKTGEKIKWKYRPLKKIGVFYWRRAQFLHPHQSFRYGETHILSKNVFWKLYPNETTC